MFSVTMIEPSGRSRLRSDAVEVRFLPEKNIERDVDEGVIVKWEDGVETHFGPETRIYVMNDKGATVASY